MMISSHFFLPIMKSAISPPVLRGMGGLSYGFLIEFLHEEFHENWLEGRSLCERAQEHNKSVKEGDSKSALNQHQVKIGHKGLSKPVIKGMSDRQ